MNDHHKQTEFLKRCLRYEESARHQELEQQITRIQRDESCVRNAVWLMAVLTALAIAGLGYPAILLANFPYSAPQTIVDLVCVLGVASLVSLVAFVILGMVYRKMLDKRRGMPPVGHKPVGVPVGQPARRVLPGTSRRRPKPRQGSGFRRQQWFSSRNGIRRAGLESAASGTAASGRHSARHRDD